MFDGIGNFPNIILPWVYAHGIKIALIIVGAILVRKFVGRLVEKAVRRAIPSAGFETKEMEQKREDTIIRIFTVTLRVVILIMALLMVLQELGISIAPLLATAGIAGLAFGFGGQYLIKDLIGGAFLILENQYRIGDVISCDGTSGVVEDITMRLTTIRDLDGTVHYIPHGEIKKVANLSRQFARVNLDIGVAYDSDFEHVKNVVNTVCQELASDEAWKLKIKKTPEFLRITDFGDSAITFKILGETYPLQQWEVTGELRSRLKIAFDKEGIEIPFPQRVIHQKK